MSAPTVKEREKILEQGAEILAQVLVPNGFKFHLITSGTSSGGAFAEGEFVKGDRKLELHVRYSLGLVTYHIGNQSLGHVDYMQALLGKFGAYPTFSEDPLAGFEALHRDLVDHCSDFLSGNGEQFCQCIAKHKVYESLTGFQKMESAQISIKN